MELVGTFGDMGALISFVAAYITVTERGIAVFQGIFNTPWRRSSAASPCAAVPTEWPGTFGPLRSQDWQSAG